MRFATIVLLCLLTACTIKLRAGDVGPETELAEVAADGEAVAVLTLENAGCPKGLGETSFTNERHSGFVELRTGPMVPERGIRVFAGRIPAGELFMTVVRCIRGREFGVFIRNDRQPLGRVTTRPGEVVYLGALRVTGEDFSVANRIDAARADLATRAPKLAEAMTLRLLKTPEDP